MSDRVSIDTGVGVSGCRGSVGIVSRYGVEVSSQGSTCLAASSLPRPEGQSALPPDRAPTVHAHALARLARRGWWYSLWYTSWWLTSVQPPAACNGLPAAGYASPPPPAACSAPPASGYAPPSPPSLPNVGVFDYLKSAPPGTPCLCASAGRHQLPWPIHSGLRRRLCLFSDLAVSIRL